MKPSVVAMYAAMADIFDKLIDDFHAFVDIMIHG